MENKVFENKVMAIVDRICETESTNCRSLNKSDLAMELFQLAGIDTDSIHIFEIPLDWDRMVAITYIDKTAESGNAYSLFAGIGYTDRKFHFETTIIGTFKRYKNPDFTGTITELEYSDDEILIADYTEIYHVWSYQTGTLEESEKAFYEKVNPGFKCTGETLEESYDEIHGLEKGGTTYVVFNGKWTPYGMCRDCGDHYIIAKWDKYIRIDKGTFNKKVDVEDK